MARATDDKRLYLAQFLVEIDLDEHPYFTDQDAHTYFLTAMKLPIRDEIRSLEVYALSPEPLERRDVVVQRYEYRGFEITISQNGDTIGTHRPTYFGVVFNLQAKYREGHLISPSLSSKRNVKKEAELYADKRREQIDKRLKTARSLRSSQKGVKAGGRGKA
jgi:hypothetical protein